MLKITRTELEDVAKEMGLKTTAKGKPLSDEALLDQIQENMEEFADDDGKFENETLAKLASAAEDEIPVSIVAAKSEKKKSAPAPEPPTKKKSKKPEPEDEDEEDNEEEEEEEEEVPAKKKSKKPEPPTKKKSKKPEPEEEDEDEDEAPKKKAKKSDKKPEKKEKKEAANTDKFGSREGSSAYLINQVLFKNAKKGVTAAQIHEVVSAQDESITKDRVNAHLRRLHMVSGLLERDAKDRYTVVKTAE